MTLNCFYLFEIFLFKYIISIITINIIWKLIIMNSNEIVDNFIKCLVEAPGLTWLAKIQKITVLELRRDLAHELPEGLLRIESSCKTQLINDIDNLYIDNLYIYNLYIYIIFFLVNMYIIYYIYK